MSLFAASCVKAKCNLHREPSSDRLTACSNSTQLYSADFLIHAGSRSSRPHRHAAPSTPRAPPCGPVLIPTSPHPPAGCKKCERCSLDPGDLRDESRLERKQQKLLFFFSSMKMFHPKWKTPGEKSSTAGETTSRASQERLGSEAIDSIDALREVKLPGAEFSSAVASNQKKKKKDDRKKEVKHPTFIT